MGKLESSQKWVNVFVVMEIAPLPFSCPKSSCTQDISSAWNAVPTHPPPPPTWLDSFSFRSQLRCYFLMETFPHFSSLNYFHPKVILSLKSVLLLFLRLVKWSSGNGEGTKKSIAGCDQLVVNIFFFFNELFNVHLCCYKHVYFFKWVI